MDAFALRVELARLCVRKFIHSMPLTLCWMTLTALAMVAPCTADWLVPFFLTWPLLTMIVLHDQIGISVGKKRSLLGLTRNYINSVRRNKKKHRFIPIYPCKRETTSNALISSSFCRSMLQAGYRSFRNAGYYNIENFKLHENIHNIVFITLLSIHFNK